MFGKILGRSKDEKVNNEDNIHKVLLEKISKMNLTDMRAYVNNKVEGFEVDEDGLEEIMKKLVTKNDETSKYYISADDMESKIKKGFDLVLMIAKHKKITVSTVEYIKEFLNVYEEILNTYDTTNKQIYTMRIKEALDNAVNSINGMAELKRKMNLLGD